MEPNRVDILQKIAPAETLFILHPESSLRDLMKYTFMNLLMQEVLVLINFDPKPVQGAARLGFAGVMIGKRFKQSEPRLHEMVFLFPFYKKPAKRIVVRHLLQMALDAAKNEVHFKQYLLDGEEMKPLFTKTFLQKLFGGVTLSDKGKSVKEDIIKQFNHYDKILPPLIKTDREKALEMISHINGNMLLLNAFKFDLIQMIGKEISIVEDELEEGGSSGGN
jgi:hypothetical protein